MLISNRIEVNYTIETTYNNIYDTSYFKRHPDWNITQALSWFNTTPSNEDLIFIRSDNASKDNSMHSKIVYEGMYYNSSYEIQLGNFPISNNVSLNLSLIRNLCPGGQKYIEYKIADDDIGDYFNYSLYWDLKFGSLYMKVDDHRLTDPEEKY
jgi:hypothetical protein